MAEGKEGSVPDCLRRRPSNCPLRGGGTTERAGWRSREKTSVFAKTNDDLRRKECARTKENGGARASTRSPKEESEEKASKGAVKEEWRSAPTG